MAASQANSGIVAKAFGGSVRRCSKTPGPASYDDLGQRFVFCPAHDDRHWTYAIDVERRGIAVPDILKLSLNAAGDEFFRRWTELEVLAKLYDVPVLALVKNPVVREKVMLDRVDTKNHWIVVGKRDIREKSCVSSDA